MNAQDSPQSPSPDQPPPVEAPLAPLLELRDPLPAVVETAAQFDDVVERFGAGTGPFAIDAERDAKVERGGVGGRVEATRPEVLSHMDRNCAMSERTWLEACADPVGRLIIPFKAPAKTRLS